VYGTVIAGGDFIWTGTVKNEHNTHSHQNSSAKKLREGNTSLSANCLDGCHPEFSRMTSYDVA